MQNNIPSFWLNISPQRPISQNLSNFRLLAIFLTTSWEFLPERRDGTFEFFLFFHVPRNLGRDPGKFLYVTVTTVSK